MNAVGLHGGDRRHVAAHDTHQPIDLVLEFGGVGGQRQSSIPGYNTLAQNARPFFSRRIGLSPTGAPVDLDYGGKISGRVGRWELGALSIRQDEFAGAGSVAGAAAGWLSIEIGTVVRARRRSIRASARASAGGLSRARRSCLCRAEASLRRSLASSSEKRPNSRASPALPAGGRVPVPMLRVIFGLVAIALAVYLIAVAFKRG